MSPLPSNFISPITPVIVTFYMQRNYLNNASIEIVSCGFGEKSFNIIPCSKHTTGIVWSPNDALFFLYNIHAVAVESLILRI